MKFWKTEVKDLEGLEKYYKDEDILVTFEDSSKKATINYQKDNDDKAVLDYLKDK